MRSTHPVSFVLLLVAATILGFGLRVWNANTAQVHEDELHYASDGLWMTVLPASSWATFLRDHPHPHLRLDLAQGRIAHWGDDGTRRHVGHPALMALILGPVLAATRPQVLGDSVPPARVVSAVADTAVIPVLAAAALGFGFQPVVALLAAVLYALSPTAATYGSLAYPDALLALWASCLMLAASMKNVLRRALLLGVFSALMAVTKGTGLLGPVFGFALLVSRGLDARTLAAFALSFAVVGTAVVDPLVYLAEVMDPLDTSARMRVDLLANLCDNVRSTMDVDHYYWLGFGQHGRPLAPALAWVSRLVTPVYLALVPVGFFILARCRGLFVAGAVALPIALLLVGVPAFNGMWRFQVCMPLVCLVVAFALAGGGPRVVVASAVLALLVMVQPLLPLRPGALGELSLPSMLFANPDATQQTNLFNMLKGRPFFAEVNPGHSLTRRLWLAPGRYRVTAHTDGELLVTVDGKRVVQKGEVLDLRGHLHVLELGSDAGCKVYSLGVTGA